jgi:hypothetical protein
MTKKNRQTAMEYERELADAKVQAHVALADAQFAHASERAAAHKALLEQAIAYERRYTDGQFGQLNLVAQEHRIFHEREHLLYEDAIDKASTALNTQLRVLEVDVGRLRDESHRFMTVDRFEREHSNLTEKMELALQALMEKIGQEEKVTVRSEAQSELMTKIGQNNKWLIGTVITVGIFGATTILHALDII